MTVEAVAMVGRSLKNALDQEARCRRVVLDEPTVDQFVAALATGKAKEAVGLASTLERVLGPEPWFRICAFDADRIGEYVFCSSRPPIVLGGSAILEQLNHDIGGSAIGGAWAIYSAGGGGLLVQAASSPADAMPHALAALFEARTHGALPVTVIEHMVVTAELVPSSSGGGLSLTLSELAESLRTRKDLTLPVDDDLPLPDDFLCDSCQQRVAAVEWVSTDRTLQLCLSCDSRRAIGQRRIHGTDFETIAQSAQSGDRSGLSLLALDGNGMGEVLVSLSTLAQVRAFSDATTSVMEMARDRAIAKAGPDACISLLSGGDEIVLVMPGGGAFEVASEMLADISAGFAALRDNEAMRATFDQNLDALERLASASVGVGVVVAPPKLPIRQLHRYAMALQRSAKDECYYRRAPRDRCSGIDFSCLTDGSALPSGSADRAAMQLRGSRAAVVQRTCRPFDVETLGAALQACKALALVAKSQVQALRELCEEGEEVATNHLGYQISRDRRGQLGWTQCLERCGVDAGSRDAIRGWLFRKSGERRGAFFLDIVELRRWVGGHHA